MFGVLRKENYSTYTHHEEREVSNVASSPKSELSWCCNLKLNKPLPPLKKVILFNSKLYPSPRMYYIDETSVPQLVWGAVAYFNVRSVLDDESV